MRGDIEFMGVPPVRPTREKPGSTELGKIVANIKN